MSTPFDYIPEVLNRAVEDAQPIDVKGKVIQVVGTIIKASVPGVKIGEVCLLRNPWEDVEVQAEVVGFTRDAVLLTALGTMIGISAETEVSGGGASPWEGSRRAWSPNGLGHEGDSSPRRVLSSVCRAAVSA